MLSKNNNNGNRVKKIITGAEKTKIAAIFEIYVSRICKTQFHWSSWMEWPGISFDNRSAVGNSPVFVVLSFGAGPLHYSRLSPDRDAIFQFLPIHPVCWEP